MVACYADISGTSLVRELQGLDTFGNSFALAPVFLEATLSEPGCVWDPSVSLISRYTRTDAKASREAYCTCDGNVRMLQCTW